MLSLYGFTCKNIHIIRFCLFNVRVGVFFTTCRIFVIIPSTTLVVTKLPPLVTNIVTNLPSRYCLKSFQEQQSLF